MMKKVLISIGCFFILSSIIYGSQAMNTPERVALRDAGMIQFHMEEIEKIVIKNAQKIERGEKAYSWNTHAWASGVIWRKKMGKLITQDDIEKTVLILNDIEMEAQILQELEEHIDSSRDVPIGI